MDVKVKGLSDLREALLGIAPKLRVRALRNALAAGARLVQKGARDAAPIISPSSPAVRKGYRSVGLVRKSISVRTSKVARQAGDVGVFVNVRPAKGAKFKTKTVSALGFGVKVRKQVRATQRGARSPVDPYYWKFIQFGTQKGTRAFRFLEAGARQLPQALKVFTQKIGPAINKLNKPKAPAP
jgi:hypothetical protein